MIRKRNLLGSLPARFAFPGAQICALLAACCSSLLADKPGQTAQTRPAQEAEAAYTQTIEKRVADILAVLDLNDPAKSAKAHDLLVARYRALRDWHDANDPKLKNASPGQAAQIRASLKAGHDSFLAGLAEFLTPAQVERVKDQMTYNQVKVTYDAYCEIVPNLTDRQKQRMLELLKEAREEAMDAGSAEEKSAVFNKFKGRINNYLTAEGHDLKQTYKDWGERRKAKTTPAASKAAK
jgi:gas vesicle protein